MCFKQPFNMVFNIFLTTKSGTKKEILLLNIFS